MNEFESLFEKYGAIVFLDTETTGLAADTDRIIELAAVRIERPTDDLIFTTSSTDLFIKLPEGEKLPEEITKLTGITDELLENEGIYEDDAVYIFEELISDKAGPVLLVAHNAQFDLQFVGAMAERYAQPCYDYLIRADYLDTLTVYKDRRAKPHKLADAIKAYKLEEIVQNSHRALDDVLALIEVCKAMDKERADLLTYVNMFGYNPKYGVRGRRIAGVTYCPQHSNGCILAPSDTLPACCKKKQTPKEEQQNAKQCKPTGPTGRHPRTQKHERRHICDELRPRRAYTGQGQRTAAGLHTDRVLGQDGRVRLPISHQRAPDRSRGQDLDEKMGRRRRQEPQSRGSHSLSPTLCGQQQSSGRRHTAAGWKRGRLQRRRRRRPPLLSKRIKKP